MIERERLQQEIGGARPSSPPRPFRRCRTPSSRSPAHARSAAGSAPAIPGRPCRAACRSVSTRSARSTSLQRPLRPCRALSTSKPAEGSCSSSTRRSFSSSSTTRMRFFMCRFAGCAPSAGRHAKHAAFAGLALHCYSTAVLVHDLRNDRQPQPHAVRLGGEERIEDGLHDAWGRCPSRGRSPQISAMPSAAARLHRHRAARRRGLRGVSSRL